MSYGFSLSVAGTAPHPPLAPPSLSSPSTIYSSFSSSSPPTHVALLCWHIVSPLMRLTPEPRSLTPVSPVTNLLSILFAFATIARVYQSPPFLIALSSL